MMPLWSVEWKLPFMWTSFDCIRSAIDQAIAVFNEKNPQSDVAIFELGPRAGRAEVATRVRLATSQQLVAVAQTSDGRYWSATADVIVMLAACIE